MAFPVKQIKGNGKSKVLSGGSSNELILGYGVTLDQGGENIVDADRAFNEVLSGGGGSDFLYAGGGSDVLDGGTGNDMLNGGTGNDVLSGGSGNDSLTGGAGNDVLGGGSDNDMLSGGTGADVLTGGTGNDSFVYASASESTAGSADIIKDFEAGKDKIDLQAIAGLRWSAASATHGVWFQTTARNKGYLYGDVDGDGSADLVIEINGTKLTAAGILLSPTAISLDENAPGATLYNLTPQAADSSIATSFAVSDERFEVVAGMLKLKNGVALDHEAVAAVNLTVTGTKAGSVTLLQNFILTVGDVNEAPTALGLSAASVAENAAGAVIGDLSVTDPDAGDTHTFTVDDERFEVVDGQLKLKDDVSLDYETASSIELTVTATDAGGHAIAQDFALTVTNVVETYQAQLIDSAVSGVEVWANGQRIGTTDANGHFNVTEGQLVTFKIGNLIIGENVSVQGDNKIYVQDLLGIDRNENVTADPRIAALAQLLQSLDADQNPDNGIDIDATRLRDGLSATSITSATQVADLLDIGITPVSRAAALDHLNDNAPFLQGTDNTPPTASISLGNLSTITAGESIAVKITFQEAVSWDNNKTPIETLLRSDHGTLSDFSSHDGGMTWEGTYTPLLGQAEASETITLNLDHISDQVGNRGLGIAQSQTFTINTSLASTETIFKNIGYYKTFFNLANAAYLKGEVQSPIGMEGDRESFHQTSWKTLTGAKLVFLDKSELLPVSSGDTQVRFDNGYYVAYVDGMTAITDYSSAATIARTEDALFLTFRGTNQMLADWQDNLFDMTGHYQRYQPLFDEIDEYLRGHEEIKTVYVAGHSLGGGMAAMYMRDHPAGGNGNIKYEAVTFEAANKFEAFHNDPMDDRFLNFEMRADPVPDLSAALASENNYGKTIFIDVENDAFVMTHLMDAIAAPGVLDVVIGQMADTRVSDINEYFTRIFVDDRVDNIGNSDGLIVTNYSYYSDTEVLRELGVDIVEGMGLTAVASNFGALLPVVGGLFAAVISDAVGAEAARIYFNYTDETFNEIKQYFPDLVVDVIQASATGLVGVISAGTTLIALPVTPATVYFLLMHEDNNEYSYSLQAADGAYVFKTSFDNGPSGDHTLIIRPLDEGYYVLPESGIENVVVANDALTLSENFKLDARYTTHGVYLMGNDANSILIGGGGADVLVGNGDEDILIGGAGNDVLFGGDFKDNNASLAELTQGRLIAEHTTVINQYVGSDAVDDVSYMWGGAGRDDFVGSGDNDYCFIDVDLQVATGWRDTVWGFNPDAGLTNSSDFLVFSATQFGLAENDLNNIAQQSGSLLGSKLWNINAGNFDTDNSYSGSEPMFYLSGDYLYFDRNGEGDGTGVVVTKFNNIVGEMNDIDGANLLFVLDFESLDWSKPDIPNRAPVFTPGEYATVDINEEGTAISNLPVLAADPENEAMQFAVVTNGTNVTVQIDANTGQWSYQPSAAAQSLREGQAVQETVTLRATDAQGLSATQDIVFTITGVNDAPTAQDASADVEHDMVYMGQLSANDPDTGDTLHYALQNSGPVHGTLNIQENGSYTYTPTTGYSGGDSFSFSATDSQGASSQATVSLTVAAGTARYTPGQSEIDLKEYGKLIAPVQVEGKWYYYWDRSGDGTSANAGSLGGGVDYTTHDVLDGIFTQDINGNANPSVDTTDIYRYATLNGVHLALPTANGDMAYPYGMSSNQPGSTVADGATLNATYDQLLAIWDAYNGAQAVTHFIYGAYGAPHGWQADSYSTATPLASGHHAFVSLRSGFVGDYFDIYDNNYVALQVLEADALVFSSGTTANVGENISTSTTVYDATVDNDIGVSYTLGGTDSELFNINASSGAVTFKVSPNYEAPADNGGNNVYDFTVTATDGSGNTANQAVALTVTDVAETAPVAGDALIPLGAYGNLIAPVQVEGKWYYYWDLSGDGTNANTGSLNGGVDITTHDLLDRIFTQDINGNANPGADTTDIYRYATLNGVHLALPTANGGMAYPSGISNSQPGTTVADGATTNATYDELLAIWDTYNGAGTGLNINGTPSSWHVFDYWSATPSASEHAVVGLGGGFVGQAHEFFFLSVALQVLETVAPVFSSAASASATENTATSTTVYDATADDDLGVSYTLSGTDSALFNINTSSGAVTFKVSQNYEAPADNGGNNVYDFTVTATDGSGNTADQAVALTVTDIAETGPVAGDEVIPLGAYGNLIAPVQVEGKWYYHWDRSGDGTLANAGSLNGGRDYTTHDVLDSIFTQDINGYSGGGGNTNDTYRYASLNGVHLALPTANGSIPYSNGIRASGTTVADGATANTTYDELLAIWDAYNGAGTGLYDNGTPSGWPGTSWSATPSASGHSLVSLYDGYVYGLPDGDSHYVTLQVLEAVASVFTSGTTASVAENAATSTTVYDATADGDLGVSYFLSGTDSALFNINASSGAVTFKVSPDYETPADSGGNNVYDFTVTATDGSGNTADQTVALTVTDVAETALVAGDALIPLGAYGNLIAPVQVEGKWYYYWDLTGDGTSANAGSLNGGVDYYTNHDILDEMFNQDINGNLNPGSDTTNVYRYAMLNDVRVALPTLGSGDDLVDWGAYMPGTEVDNVGESNSTYDDLLAIWDAFNGSGTVSSRRDGVTYDPIDGTPPGWQPSNYWSATPGSVHAALDLSAGYADDYNGGLFVALELVGVGGSAELPIA